MINVVFKIGLIKLDIRNFYFLLILKVIIPHDRVISFSEEIDVYTSCCYFDSLLHVGSIALELSGWFPTRIY